MWCELNILLSICTTINAMQVVVSTFTIPNREASLHLTHLTLDEYTGNIYVGSVNKIYKLSGDLRILQTLTTGPINESSASGEISLLVDNVNKALVIDYSLNRLITCGTGHQGMCSVRDLHDLTQGVQEVPGTVVATSAAGSTVAFIAPGPSNSSNSNVLYVGTSYTGHTPAGDYPPAVSSRSLEEETLFKFAVQEWGTRIYVNSLSVDQYPINYVYGFSSKGFSYFLTYQLYEVGSDEYYSKITRICQKDENYYSYTEIPITCGDVDYNLVTSASVGQPGILLARQLGIKTEDDVLFATFSKSEVKSDRPLKLSAICVYSLKSIRRKFTENIKSCFSGIGSRGLDYFTPSSNCLTTQISDSIDDDFCGLEVNTPLGGNQAIHSQPLLVSTEQITAITAAPTGDNTVLFVGTARGHVKKLSITNDSVEEYSDTVIEEGSPVNKDIFLDPTWTRLFLMTEHKIVKLKF